MDKEVKKIYDKYIAMIKKSRNEGRQAAADNLQHWLNGNGKERKLDWKWLRSFPSILKAEKTNEERFVEKTIYIEIKKHVDDKKKLVREKQDYWDVRITASVTKELYYASGTSTIASRGRFLFKEKSGNIMVSGTVEHHWWDPYDWHKGLGAYIPGFGRIEDSDALKLERNGYGKAFAMYSFWHKQFSGKYGIDKGILNVDTWKYAWSAAWGGRAPAASAGSWNPTNDTYTDSKKKLLPGLNVK